MRHQQESDLIETSCPILNTLSMSFDLTLHGVSTMIVFKQSQETKEYKLLKSFIKLGEPIVRLIHDEQQHREHQRFVVRTHTKTNALPKFNRVEPMYTHLQEKNDEMKSIRLGWTSEDDWKLVRAVDQHDGRWRTIARALNLGSDDRLRNRWVRIVKGTKSQPDIIEEARRVAKKMESASQRTRTRMGKTSKFQRLTYTSTPSSAWTVEEDAEIIRIISNPHLWTRRAPWFYLASKIEGRTRHAIRNRAHRLVLCNSTRWEMCLNDLECRL